MKNVPLLGGGFDGVASLVIEFYCFERSFVAGLSVRRLLVCITVFEFVFR